MFESSNQDVSDTGLELSNVLARTLGSWILGLLYMSYGIPTMRAMNMLRLLLSIGLLLWSYFQAYANATKTAFSIHQTFNGIMIAAANVNISDAIKEICRQSGIQFKVYLSHNDGVVSGNFIAQDWDTAINKLLTDFNYVKILDNHKKTQKVIVLSIKSPLIKASPLADEHTSTSSSALSSKTVTNTGEQFSLLDDQSINSDQTTGSEPTIDTESEIIEDQVEYSSSFDFEGGTHPAEDEVRQFYDQILLSEPLPTIIGSR